MLFKKKPFAGYRAIIIVKHNPTNNSSLQTSPSRDSRPLSQMPPFISLTPRVLSHLLNLLRLPTIHLPKRRHIPLILLLRPQRILHHQRPMPPRTSTKPAPRHHIHRVRAPILHIGSLRRRHTRAHAHMLQCRVTLPDLRRIFIVPCILGDFQDRT